MAYGSRKAEKMDRPVRGQGLIDVRDLRVDQQPLAFGDDGALAVYDKFPLSFDAVEPLVKGHPARAADGLLPVADSDQLQPQREWGMVGGVVDLEHHNGHLLFRTAGDRFVCCSEYHRMQKDCYNLRPNRLRTVTHPAH